MADPKHIEHLARAMCEADGINPNAVMVGAPNDFALHGADFSAYKWDCEHPAWHRYRRQANLFIAAQAAQAEWDL